MVRFRLTFISVRSLVYVYPRTKCFTLEVHKGLLFNGPEVVVFELSF